MSRLKREKDAVDGLLGLNNGENDDRRRSAVEILSEMKDKRRRHVFESRKRPKKKQKKVTNKWSVLVTLCGRHGIDATTRSLLYAPYKARKNMKSANDYLKYVRNVTGVSRKLKKLIYKALSGDEESSSSDDSSSDSDRMHTSDDDSESETEALRASVGIQSYKIQLEVKGTGVILRSYPKETVEKCMQRLGYSMAFFDFKYQGRPRQGQERLQDFMRNPRRGRVYTIEISTK